MRRAVCNKVRILLLATVLSGAMCMPVVAIAQDNVFQRGISAVKNFFKHSDDGKEKQNRNEENNMVGSSFDDYTAEQLNDLTFEENLRTPSLGKSAETIKKHQLTEARKMIVRGMSVETTRNGEVIIATIPTDRLFSPNDTVLRPKADELLQPFLKYVEVSDMYRILLAVHSDNTGVESYTDNLTRCRVLAVLDWFKDNALNCDYIIPYAMGAIEPLYSNNSMENREKNRRLEIYIIPGKRMIELAEAGQLTD